LLFFSVTGGFFIVHPNLSAHREGVLTPHNAPLQTELCPVLDHWNMCINIILSYLHRAGFLENVRLPDKRKRNKSHFELTSCGARRCGFSYATAHGISIRKNNNSPRHHYIAAAAESETNRPPLKPRYIMASPHVVPIICLLSKIFDM
jgi:hypothetical protein